MSSKPDCSRCGVRLDYRKQRVPTAQDQEPTLPPEAAAYAAERAVAFSGWLHNYPGVTHGNCYRVVLAENALLQLHSTTAQDVARRGRSASSASGYKPPESRTRTHECAAPRPHRHAGAPPRAPSRAPSHAPPRAPPRTLPPAPPAPPRAPARAPPLVRSPIRALTKPGPAAR